MKDGFKDISRGVFIDRLVIFGAPAAWLLLIVVAVLLLILDARAAETIRGPRDAVVLGVVDGDTIRVRTLLWFDEQSVTVKVRFANADAAELRARCAEEKRLALAAQAWVSERLLGKTVQLFDIKQDKYKERVDARVVLDGEDIGLALIAAGLGRPYKGEKRRSWCP